MSSAVSPTDTEGASALEGFPNLEATGGVDKCLISAYFQFRHNRHLQLWPRLFAAE